MHRWILRLAFLGLAVWLLFVSFAQQDLRAGGRLPTAKAPPRILIAHSGEAEAERQAVMAGNLAGRYARVRLRASEDLEPQEAARAAAVFAVGAVENAGLTDRAGRPPFRLAALEGRDGAVADAVAAALSPNRGDAPRLLVRIGGIGPESSPRKIVAIADALAAEGIPFLLSVREIDLAGAAVGLSDRPLLVNALRHAARSGGRTIAELGEALPPDDVRRWRSRLLALREEWERAGLAVPVIVSIPAERASSEAYAAARGLFAGLVGPVRYPIPGSGGELVQDFPHETVDLRGDFVIPGGAASPRADRLATLTRHWSDDPESIRDQALRLKAQGFRPIGLETVIASAPPHAETVPEVSAVSMASASWLRALPRLDVSALIALLAFVAAMWLGGEVALSRLGQPSARRAQRVRPARRASAWPAR